MCMKVRNITTHKRAPWATTAKMKKIREKPPFGGDNTQGTVLNDYRAMLSPQVTLQATRMKLITKCCR